MINKQLLCTTFSYSALHQPPRTYTEAVYPSLKTCVYSTSKQFPEKPVQSFIFNWYFTPLHLPPAGNAEFLKQHAWSTNHKTPQPVAYH